VWRYESYKKPNHKGDKVTLSECERIVTKAIREKLVIEVDYIKKDGTRSDHRLLEPFDIAVGKRTKIGELVLWGWCLGRENTVERKTPNILSIRITDQHFDPKEREREFSSLPDYRIPRDW